MFWGIGGHPNKQICEEWSKGQFEKMSEPVQVYTACQFVTKTQLSFLSLIFLFNDYVWVIE